MTYLCSLLLKEMLQKETVASLFLLFMDVPLTIWTLQICIHIEAAKYGGECYTAYG